MNEQEYRAAPGLNYSAMANFYQSPDHALMKTKEKGYFNEGHALEGILRGDFDKKFFHAGGKVCDEIYQNLSDLESVRVFNLDGSPNMTHKSRHAAIDECQANPGLIPIYSPELEIMAANTRKIEWRFPMTEIFRHGKWNVPLFFDGKKCLVDLMLELRDEIILFDIKTAASFGAFMKMLKAKYWIQDLHYQSVVEGATGKPCSKMFFIVASKEKPNLAKIFSEGRKPRI